MMNDDKDIAFAILMDMPKSELATSIIRMRSQLEDASLKLALAKVSIAESHATIKRNNRALARMNRQRRSLKNTVKRRRKNAR